MHSLRSKLNRINNNSYKLYKSLLGQYQFEGFRLTVDRVQGDPFASPSKITLTLPLGNTGFPHSLWETPVKSLAFRDALSRVVAKNIRRLGKNSRGTGNSGTVAINHGSQKILERNSILIDKNELKIRLFIGLPAYGRRIAGHEAEELLLEEIPALVEESLYWKKLDNRYFYSFVNLAQKQEEIRSVLPEMGLVSFIADGSILPRSSGVKDVPLEGAVPFSSPPSLRVKIPLSDGSEVVGMGVPRGITLITGGGFHGKSTLLNAIQAGIYRHIPGDGREYVISLPDTVKIRAEDGRYVAGVDISTFINHLPGGKTTEGFYTENASGSTSQAANIIEAAEIGCQVMLMDEDTSATNFLIRDKRMQELIPADKEPITPYIDVARRLHEEKEISSILVVGGSGDYIDIADTVILMDNYRAVDATARAKEIAARYPYTHIREFDRDIRLGERVPLPESIDASKGKRESKISSFETGILFGREKIELSAWEHIVDRTQYDTIGDTLYYLVKTGLTDGKKSLKDILFRWKELVEQNGWDEIARAVTGTWNAYCEVRPLDIAAALNRLRTLKVR